MNTKKVFAYVGSRNASSQLTLYVKDFLSKLAVKSNGTIQYDLYTASDMNINHSTGCRNCFDQGTCELDNKPDDHMKLLKQNMLEADFIILASPVYSHNVSGDMKAFIDRISYWCHLMRLAGKPGIAIASAHSNGVHHVLNYLGKILTFLGVAPVEKIGIVKIENSSEEQLDMYVNQAYEYVAGSKKVESNEELESAFQTMKWVIGNQPPTYTEHIYWTKNGLFDCDSFQDLLHKNESNKLLNPVEA
ncbi:flavodoxin family protein [Paenibacillus profundus]|uniref:Flavodoxin family protein n=1 Tax=Paenibacillus profundus TaxID=1173085 RepID=A0ABS8YMH6_9BACL|nr:flavodoxin family protein [Paenibacillus profundus]MCE5173036.1 flavodoxin family protein [Paenibacillus profundus]